MGAQHRAAAAARWAAHYERKAKAAKAAAARWGSETARATAAALSAKARAARSDAVAARELYAADAAIRVDAELLKLRTALDRGERVDPRTLERVRGKSEALAAELPSGPFDRALSQAPPRSAHDVARAIARAARLDGLSVAYEARRFKNRTPAPSEYRLTVRANTSDPDRFRQDIARLFEIATEYARRHSTDPALSLTKERSGQRYTFRPGAIGYAIEFRARVANRSRIARAGGSSQSAGMVTRGSRGEFAGKSIVTFRSRDRGDWLPSASGQGSPEREFADYLDFCVSGAVSQKTGHRFDTLNGDFATWKSATLAIFDRP